MPLIPHKLGPEDAVFAIDVQNDFCAGGALSVPRADEVVPVLNRWIEESGRRGVLIVISRDWHPANHCSFREQGGPWPAHCVQHTRGAELHPGLRHPPMALLVSKASTPEREAYSDFDGTGLADLLRRLGVQRLWVGGLATDYCVRATVLDGLREGFEVHLIRAGIRAVDVRPGDGQRAIDEMKVAGAIVKEVEHA